MKLTAALFGPALATVATVLAGCMAGAPVQAQAGGEAATEAFRLREPSQEVIYFLLPDRFENGDRSNDLGDLQGGPFETGYDPADKGFFHGGDLKGLAERLDYIQGMGITAIWIAPIFQNKAVQGAPGQESAGYHGYWVTDFTRPDAHFGTREEFAALVRAAHARGMKVYMDIITNHTADVIGYAGGQTSGYAYRSRGDFPYSTRGGPDGEPVNPGFMGDENPSEENFARLVDPGYAYTPVVPEAESDAKVPAWLNDPVYYHNRGNSTFTGESSRFGDFSGLDDLFTEHPRVVAGMIDIYASWIREFRIDGFRVDTARHVNPQFWQQFVPAMQETAREVGVPNFHIFGEVARDDRQAGYFAEYTRRDGFPAVLDFAFQLSMREVLGQGKGTNILAELFDGDVLYEGGEAAALGLPTFLGNHDMGRFSTLIKEDMPGIGQGELLARVKLGHAMLMVLRGSPVIYYGDEQGFVGDGNDQQAREDMFPSQTGVYNDNDLIGTEATTATENFDASHPVYRLIGELAGIRRAHPALANGRQVTRHYEQEPGIFAVSRFDPRSGAEYLAVFNTSDAPRRANVMLGYDARSFENLGGSCPAAVTAPGSAAFDLPAFGWAICRVSEVAE